MLQQNFVKQRIFRQPGSWKQIAQLTADWINVNLNIHRIIVITSHVCHWTNQLMITVYYNDGLISEDILAVTKNMVLNFELFETKKTVQFTWAMHNQKCLPEINKISNRGKILAINSCQSNAEHKINVTLVWYVRNK